MSKEHKYFLGIDIGSTATKVVLLDEEDMVEHFVLPTGWSSKEVAHDVQTHLIDKGYNFEDIYVIATGYGRVAVDFADKIITEISCHGRGGYELMQEDCTMIDIGGQDTKIITVVNGKVLNFLMNDKCSAGTGKFLEIMANRLGVDLEELFSMAAKGNILPISSMCTVFAESEVISHIGNGEKREDIAAGVVDSVVKRVAGLAQRHGVQRQKIFLSGGLCDSDFIIESLGKELRSDISSNSLGRYAGAYGAALLARDGEAKRRKKALPA